MADNCQVVPHSNSSQRYLIIFDYRVKIWFYAVGLIAIAKVKASTRSLHFELLDAAVDDVEANDFTYYRGML